MPGCRIALIGVTGLGFYEINRNGNKKGAVTAPLPAVRLEAAVRRRIILQYSALPDGSLISFQAVAISLTTGSGIGT
jgi:hypothetical protein